MLIVDGFRLHRASEERNTAAVVFSAIFVPPESPAQKQLTGWIAAHHCANLKAFTETRKYYGLFRVDTKPSAAPEGFDLDYLTWPELKRYSVVPQHSRHDSDGRSQIQCCEFSYFGLTRMMRSSLGAPCVPCL